MSPSLASSPGGRFGTSNAPKKADHLAAPDELAAAHLDGALRWLNSQRGFVELSQSSRRD